MAQGDAAAALFLTTAAQLNSEQLKPLLIGLQPGSSRSRAPSVRNLTPRCSSSRRADSRNVFLSCCARRRSTLLISASRSAKHSSYSSVGTGQTARGRNSSTAKCPRSSAVMQVRAVNPVSPALRVRRYAATALLHRAAVGCGRAWEVSRDRRAHSSLHPMLMRFIVRLIHDPKFSRRARSCG